ncbi:unnamed protein product, partial [Mesorhabditis spiculigera]
MPNHNSVFNVRSGPSHPNTTISNAQNMSPADRAACGGGLARGSNGQNQVTNQTPSQVGRTLESRGYAALGGSTPSNQAYVKK